MRGYLRRSSSYETDPAVRAILQHMHARLSVAKVPSAVQPTEAGQAAGGKSWTEHPLPLFAFEHRSTEVRGLACLGFTSLKTTLPPKDRGERLLKTHRRADSTASAERELSALLHIKFALQIQIHTSKTQQKGRKPRKKKETILCFSAKNRETQQMQRAAPLIQKKNKKNNQEVPHHSARLLRVLH